MSARRRAVTSRNSSRTACPESERRDATHASLRAPISFVTCEGTSTRGGGDASPSSVRSIPIRCDSTSRTAHPGHSDGISHSASSRSSADTSMAPHSSARIPTTGSPAPVITAASSCAAHHPARRRAQNQCGFRWPPRPPTQQETGGSRHNAARTAVVDKPPFPGIVRASAGHGVPLITRGYRPQIPGRPTTLPPSACGAGPRDSFDLPPSGAHGEEDDCGVV